MKSSDLPLHYSNSFQRLFGCPKYSHEISPRSHFILQHREQLVLMALNRSPYDARVTPPKQGWGGELSERDHLPRLHSSHPVTHPLFGLLQELLLGSPGCWCGAEHGDPARGAGRKLAHGLQLGLCTRMETPIPEHLGPVNHTHGSFLHSAVSVLVGRHGAEESQGSTGPEPRALGADHSAPCVRSLCCVGCRSNLNPAVFWLPQVKAS